MKLITSH